MENSNCSHTYCMYVCVSVCLFSWLPGLTFAREDLPSHSLCCHPPPSLSALAALTFLLFLKHTRHVLTSGLWTGCTLCLEGLPPEATWPLPSPISSPYSNLTFSVSLIWQPCLKQQSHPLHIFLKPLSCSIFFTLSGTLCLKICF